MREKNVFQVFTGGRNYLEVRILQTRQGTVSGYFNNSKELDRAIKPYDGQNNIFFTLNELDTKIIARSKNHLTTYAKHTTTDSEIVRRKWILIDLDPVRPAGVSSTEGELKAAETLYTNVLEYLSTKGFSEPVYAMSGNGYHILLPIDLPNDQNSTKIVKEFLHAMDKRFSNENVKVDTSTYNAARIVKLYGTIACKGDDTEERPHRRSYIISVPETLEPVESALLEAVTKEILVQAKPPKQLDDDARKENRIPVKDYLEAHGIEISHEKSYEAGGICYVLKTCPWNPEHTDKAAYVIEFPNGKIAAGCHHDSCREENWRSLLKKYPDERMEYQKTVRKASGGKREENLGAAELLLRDIEQEGHEFYHDKGGTAFVSVNRNGYLQYFQVKEKGYRQYLIYMYLKAYGKSVSKDSIQQVLDTIEVKALMEGEEIEPAYRCKNQREKLYYCLGDKEQTVICIDEEGYHFMEKSEIPFIQKSSMMEQQIPMKSKKSFRNLAKKHWKLATKEDEILHNILLVTRFISDIPLPLIYYHGDRGASKTTSMRMDKMLVDPAQADLKVLSNNAKDVIPALASGYMVCFDNVSGISGTLADIFCISATQGFYTKRELYSDNSEITVKLNSRISFTGITTLSNKPDLLDRIVCVKFSRLEKGERRTSKEVMCDFENDIPFLLDRIFRILSKALVIHKTLKLNELPRMADFAKWGYAVAEVMGYGGETFLQIYEENQRNLLDTMIEEDTLATVLIAFVRKERFYKGKMTELLVKLTDTANTMRLNTKSGWVKDASVLSRRLSQLESVISLFHISMKRGKKDGNRFVELSIDEGESEDKVCS